MVTERFPLGRENSDRTLAVRATGESIWMFDDQTVWDLSRNATPLPFASQKPSGVTPQEVDEMSKRPVRGPRACKGVEALTVRKQHSGGFALHISRKTFAHLGCDAMERSQK
jgi:hypothetical protein